MALCVVTCGGAAAAGGAIVATTVAAQVGVAAAGVSSAAFMSAAVSKAVETGVYESRKHKHEEDVDKVTSPGKRKGKIMSENNTPKNNKAQNRQMRAMEKKYKLNKDKRRELHDLISKWGLGFP